VSQAGGQLLIDTARATGFGGALMAPLARWRLSRGRHDDPGKVAWI